MLCALFGVRLGAACVAKRSVAEPSFHYKCNQQLVATARRSEKNIKKLRLNILTNETKTEELASFSTAHHLIASLVTIMLMTI